VEDTCDVAIVGYGPTGLVAASMLGADPLVDRAQAEVFTGASDRGRLEFWPDGEHTIDNHADERDALVGDWLADILTRTAVDGKSL
jgi:thioredoxin reductase